MKNPDSGSSSVKNAQHAEPSKQFRADSLLSKEVKEERKECDHVNYIKLNFDKYLKF